MSGRRQLLSQLFLHMLIAAGLGLAVWVVGIWRVYEMWHPAGGLGMDAAAVWDLKLQTILTLYVPLGALLGVALSLVEPTQDIGFLSALKTEYRWLLLGLVVGGAAAFGGGYLGETAFREMFSDGATELGRALGTVCIGVSIGGALGIVDRLRTSSNDRLLAGVVGGLIGGVVAAILFQFVITSIEAMTVLSLMVLAACIAGAMGSVTYLQTQAMLVGTSDNIFKYNPVFSRRLMRDAPNRIGSGLPTRASSSTDFRIAQDQDVMSEHAVIQYDRPRRTWYLARMTPAATELFVNRKRLQDQTVPLRDRDVITIGRTHFIFRRTR